MVDTSSLNVATKNVLEEVAKQAQGLAVGLQMQRPHKKAVATQVCAISL